MGIEIGVETFWAVFLVFTGKRHVSFWRWPASWFEMQITLVTPRCLFFSQIIKRANCSSITEGVPLFQLACAITTRIISNFVFHESNVHPWGGPRPAQGTQQTASLARQRHHPHETLFSQSKIQLGLSFSLHHFTKEKTKNSKRIIWDISIHWSFNKNR